MNNKKLISPEGMTVVASVSSQKPEKLPTANNNIVLNSQAWFWKKLFKCGHRGPSWFELNAYGTISKKIKDNKLCPDCLIEKFKKYTIKCAACKLPILPGEGVALYGIESEDLSLNDATIVNDTSVIGCLRMNCCPSGGFFAGHWTENGFRPVFKNKVAAEHVCS